MSFRSKIKFNKKELKKFILFLDEFIEYRGGMGNRIDAWHIQDKLKGKLRYVKQKQRSVKK